MKLDTTTTICAIATGHGSGLRGAVRLTGPNTLAILTSAFAIDIGSWGSRAACRTFEVPLPGLGPIELKLFVWPNRRSYTGQPSAEIHTHGSQVLLQAVQKQLIQSGAIVAQPGEFTLRAFLAGRLDLMQCEAVLGVIHAHNDRALQVALSQLAGGLSSPLTRLRKTLIELLADIEAGLDFVDEDIQFIEFGEIVRRLQICESDVQKLIDQMESRSGQQVAMTVVLIGAPNSGKSSLFNAIAKQQVAIVSPEPGTTRDYVRLRLTLGDARLDLIDTAGIETIDDQSPRHLAQDFTREQLRDAQLVLHCMDDALETKAPTLVPLELSHVPIWKVRTKSDLIETRSTELKAETPIDKIDLEIATSAWTGHNIDVLMEHLTQWASRESEQQQDVVPMTATRCHESLHGAQRAIQEAIQSVQQLRGDEVTASEIRIALDELGTVAGEVYTDDILDALFSRFCIGK